MEINANFPEKLGFLFQPARYKVVPGGRGSGKSWGYARALLLLGVANPLRILCTREIQKSIKDSVHKLLTDQIQLLGLGKKYQALENEIRGVNGTSFIFAGLAELTIESIKSYEGCDIVWCEEAQVISKRSWDVLIPTIRKDDSKMYGGANASEIWVTLNPELESDPTYERFIKNPPPDSVVVKMNWCDNPWFNKVLDSERLYCLQNNPKDYQNIWEGECKPAVEGAIFFDEVAAMEREHRIRNVPYDPMLKAHVVIDLGHGHACAVGIVQVMTSEIRVIWYNEYFNTKLSEIGSDLMTMKYNWGKVWLPFADGFSKSSKGQDSADMIMAKLGFNCAKKSDVGHHGVDEGIRIARERFPRFYWDEMNCSRLIECARRYRRSINRATLTAGAPLQDEFADGGDFIRYVSVNADSMTNDTDTKRRPVAVSYGEPLDAVVGF